MSPSGLASSGSFQGMQSPRDGSCQRPGRANVTQEQTIFFSIAETLTNNQKCEDIKDQDTPKHLLDSPGDVLARVLCLSCGDTDQFCTLE